MNARAGMSALSVCMPAEVRTNDYWRARYPDVVKKAEDRSVARFWAAPSAPSDHPFDVEMAPYLDDVFRGTVERRIAGPGETALALEARAARAALAAAKMTPGDVDLTIVSSFMPDQLAVGNAAFLVRELGLRCAAWNLESACSSAVVALNTASALVRAGECKNVLVVVSALYSRMVDEADSVSWVLGDGVAAFVVTPQPEGVGVLGSRTVHTADTCGMFVVDTTLDEQGRPRYRTRMGDPQRSNRMARDTAEGYLRECADGATRAAGVSLRDVDFFVFNTPAAWYAPFCGRVLGVDASKWINPYARYANMGPALMPVTLHEAASQGRIRPGSLVMLYSIGSTSTASATIVRWGDVALARA